MFSAELVVSNRQGIYLTIGCRRQGDYDLMHACIEYELVITEPEVTKYNNRAV